MHDDFQSPSDPPVHSTSTECSTRDAMNTPETQSAVRSMRLLGCAVELLKVAKCPNCDGSGAVAVQTRSRQLVTREMAMDAGSPEMEGSLYSDDEWEQQQCQWCNEKNTLLVKYATITKHES